ncbi:MAG: nucleotidyltransferase domain-containing protein, partial [Verrucomicrobiota bacterium]
IDLGVDEEDLDITGWDLRKALPLFRKANGSLMEWLHSPIVYLEDSEVMKEWREMVSDYFLPKNSAGHYVGLSRKIWGRISEKGEVTAKKYLYVLRSLLSAKYVVENQMVAPVAFDELRDRVEVAEGVSEKISGMIAEKALGRESDVILRDPVLDAFIKEELLQVDAEISKLSSSLGSVEALDRFFRRVIENA